MARGFLSIIQQIARDVERERRKCEREAERRQVQERREMERARKASDQAARHAAHAAEAQRKRRAAEAKDAHIEARQAEVATLNARLEEKCAAIDNLLAASLDIDHYFDLNTLRRKPEHPPFEHYHLDSPTRKPTSLRDPPEPVYKEPTPPKALFHKKKKHEAAIAAARAAHALAKAEWRSEIEKHAARRKAMQREYEQAEEKRLKDLEKEKIRYSRECAKREREVAKYNERIDSLLANLSYGVVDAVETYYSIVFQHSLFPRHFPVSRKFKFNPSTAELRLRVAIPPPLEMVTTKVFRYVKKNDQIVSTDLSQKAQRERYSSAVHQVALRSINEVFQADRKGLIKSVSLEVGTETADPGTGKMGFIPFAAVAAEREAFLEFDLSAVVPKSTLEHLGASLSKDPFRLMAAGILGVRRV